MRRPRGNSRAAPRTKPSTAQLTMLAELPKRIGCSASTPLVIDAKIADDGGAWWLAEAFAGH